MRGQSTWARPHRNALRRVEEESRETVSLTASRIDLQYNPNRRLFFDPDCMGDATLRLCNKIKWS